MKLMQLLSEVEFHTYTAMVQVIYDDQEGSSKIAELIRALPGVTTVTLAADEGDNRETLKVKLITQKSGLEAFQALKQNALTKYKEIRVVNIGEKTIEKK